MHEDTGIGSSLRKIRKRRGLTQRELATASGVSLSLIRKLEQGEITDTRMETAHTLASTLRVPTSYLLERDDEEPAGEAAEPWRPLRQAVQVAPVRTGEAPTVEGVRAMLPEVRSAYFDNRLGELTGLLAPLLVDADALGDSAEARDVRSHLLQIAGSVLTQVRQYGAAETALRRALDDAPDRLRAAGIIATWSWLLVRQGKLAASREMATKWADDVEPRVSRATPEELAAWGWLLIQSSAAALRDNRRGEADDTMRLAQSVSVLLGRELPRGTERLTTWGPTTVRYKACERHIVLDEPDKVLRAAKPKRPGRATARKSGGLAVSTEYHRHRLDVAKAHTMMRQYPEAVDVLTSVHATAPEWLASQRYARDILGDVVEKRRTLTPDMRTLADAVSLPL
ncbi:DNA-binding protein [Streptomyces violaceusniger]|uniref:Helix-turn-helix transcriptional regulator n=2 Tax=Streptomyces violaceusniger group TaxID=2839105 RepID=A0ABD5J3M9_9ACTN|nr:helix-turn-helix transcriptional regulator [Streptomyces violaceusniger]KUL67035.1 DNA-binding protein [Streptomyces violaceusniger]MEE4582589.1 helix-turn-helix transcriptional regulator [Streptomyces sp. DSM 41602]